MTTESFETSKTTMFTGLENGGLIRKSHTINIKD